ncbi:MAG TPA: GTP-binding protein [Anaerolineae bacterium]|mgnify:CR=1 FL=1|nr:GTP-binding protein [Anaerolineae bacterium]HQI86771.1 GTP-binding protein [Anaerolineae bacterium]
MNHESKRLWHDSVIHDSVVHDSARLHIVGGFLGSGKTTAIIGAAKQLMARGKRVGVVTNDQGKYLVDTAFFALADVPTVEVTGGCFCCNYDDLDARLDQLKHTAQPDVIFAESVGSCADIVATVVKPLLTLRQETPPTSFSVFADARLLRRRLLDLPMPFSDDVVYIFDKQIEEAGLLVINKVDLLETRQEAGGKKQEFTMPQTQSPIPNHELLALAQRRFPAKPIRLQNSLDAEDVAGWVGMLESGTIGLPGAPLEMDYARYGAGEARLAWLDETVTLRVAEGQGRAVALRAIGAIVDALRQRQAAVGHLKFLVRGAAEDVKVSFPTLDEAGWEQAVPPLSGTQVTLLINARVEMGAETLRNVVAQAVQQAVATSGAAFDESAIAFFHPGFPNPTHRIS